MGPLTGKKNLVQKVKQIYFYVDLKNATLAMELDQLGLQVQNLEHSLCKASI